MGRERANHRVYRLVKRCIPNTDHKNVDASNLLPNILRQNVSVISGMTISDALMLDDVNHIFQAVLARLPKVQIYHPDYRSAPNGSALSPRHQNRVTRKIPNSVVPRMIVSNRHNVDFKRRKRFQEPRLCFRITKRVD